MSSKIFKIGMQEFESCGKDIINLLSLKDEMEMVLQNAELYILGTTSDIDLSKFPYVKVHKGEIPEDEQFDVIVCVGGILPKQENRIKELRRKSDKLLALGTCTVWGCRPTIALSAFNEEERNEINEDMEKNSPEFNQQIASITRKTLEDIVKVDYKIPGCPIDEFSFVSFLMDLVEGKLPHIQDAPVCYECKMNGNECIFMEKGIVCLGPITQCGCGARCITLGEIETGLKTVCTGCFGPLADANLDEWYKMILRYGKSVENIFKFFVAR